jgi:hypothetical protein
MSLGFGRRRAWPSGAALALVCALGTGCSASHHSNGKTGAGGTAGGAGAGGGGDAGAGGTGAGGTSMTGAGGGGDAGAGVGGFGGGPMTGGGGAGGGDCSDTTKGNIYVLGQDKQFARFSPQTEMLTVMGTLNCPGEDSFSTTFSMSVDRQGIAWVLFQNGNIYHVDTKTLACTATGFQPCQNSFCTFGMGFVADAPNSDQETLYISGAYNGSPGQGLAKLDTKTLKVIPVKDYDLLAGKDAELTGTGDARLFGYFQDMPIRLAEIDKTNAHIITEASLNQIPTGTSWAFAFWGGMFYIMSGTGIRKYDPKSTITTLINGNVGFNIVGAGVSTCAPTDIPK